jgi:shikimate dehydrogenase
VSTPNVFTLEDLRGWKGSAPLQLAVLGDPVAHSASPPMHMAALEACGLAHTYGRIHIRPEDLPEAIRLLTESMFIGVNLTIPHKTAILPLLNAVDPHAKVMGAVNTVLFKEGRLTGFNTDGKGLTRAIAEDFGVELGALRVLILGAGGGAGRSIALQCALEGCPKITLVNRTRQKAETLAQEIASLERLPQPPPIVTALGTDSVTLSAHLEATDIILQCSSLGMKDGDPSPLPLRFLRREHLVYDTIYSRPTQLLADARAVGARASDGLSMLLHQGALAFEIWFQRTAPVDPMRTALALFRASVSR